MQRQHIFSIPSADHQRDWECAPDVLATVPVISLMKDDEYGEADLGRDLALQHGATIAAVRLLRAVSAGGADTDGAPNSGST